MKIRPGIVHVTNILHTAGTGMTMKLLFVQEKTLLQPLTLFRISAPHAQFSHERQSPLGGKKYFSEMHFILSTREERFRIFRGALLKSSIFFRQCETQVMQRRK